MAEIIIAGLLLTGLYASVNGAVAGTYVIFGILSLHIFTIVAMSCLAPFKDKGTFVRTHEKTSTRVLLQVFMAAATYHLYAIGYEVFVGVLLVTLTISAITNIASYLEKET